MLIPKTIDFQPQIYYKFPKIFKKTRSWCPAASGGSKNKKKTRIIQNIYTKNIYYSNNLGVGVPLPPAVRKIQKWYILFKKPRNPCPAASGGLNNPKKHIYIYIYILLKNLRICVPLPPAVRTIKNNIYYLKNLRICVQLPPAVRKSTKKHT